MLMGWSFPLAEDLFWIIPTVVHITCSSPQRGRLHTPACDFQCIDNRIQILNKMELLLLLFTTHCTKPLFQTNQI